MPDDLFKISVIDGALCIRRHLQTNNGSSVLDATRQLKDGPASLASLDYRRAIMLGEKAGWDAFVIHGSRQAQLRETLKNLVLRLQPLWARAAAWGRERVLMVVSDDTRQLLGFAGLLDKPMPEEVSGWWMEVSNVFRAAEMDQRVDMGREGELLTLAHEQSRLIAEGIAREPVWIALEDAGAGYDVLSYRRDDKGQLGELRIEVKAHTFLPSHFTLTRNEWEVAGRSADRYLIHVWNLETKHLRQVTVPEVTPHVPKDNGKGAWQQVKIAAE